MVQEVIKCKACRGAYTKMVNRIARYQLGRAFYTWLDRSWEAQQHQVCVLTVKVMQSEM